MRRALADELTWQPNRTRCSATAAANPSGFVETLVELGPLAPMVLCDRCGHPADAQRLDVSTYAERGAWAWGQIVCRTDGCVGEDGSPWVDPPDVPGQLTREDRRWLRRQQQIVDEYAQVSRRLLREVGE